MAAYMIRHAKGQQGDILIEDDDLAVNFTSGWVVFTDDHPTLETAVVLAIPTEHVAAIQRVDHDDDGNTTTDPTSDGPAPQE